MASPGPAPLPLASPPTAPPGWHTRWSEQDNQWYYVDTATGISQWDYPTVPVHGADPQPTPQHPAPPQYPQTESPAAQGDAAQEPEASRGLMSMAAGAFLGHEMHEHSHHNHHNLLGSVTTFLGGAGAGALGAKFFGGGKKPQPAQNVQSSTSQPPFQGYPASPPPAPYYPTHTPPVPGYAGQHMPPAPGYFAMGAGAGVAAGAASAMAMNAAGSNYPPHQYQQQQQPASPSVGGYTGMAPFQPASFSAGPRLTIHAAAFADKDVTGTVRILAGNDQQISLQKKLTEQFGDPWPEAGRKGLSILYQYGDRPMEVWAGSSAEEIVTIKNEALSNERMSFINKNPGRIICLIWGQESVLSDARIEKLEKEGELDCKDLGDGKWWAWEQRTLICYYRGPHGGVEIGHAREGGTLRLPWNPLAKWS